MSAWSFETSSEPTCGTDEVSPDGGKLEEEEEDAEEAHDDLVVVQACQMGVAVADLENI